MFTFRQKIFITYVVVFLAFIAIMFPFASETVKKIVTKGMRDRATELILKITPAANDEELVENLKTQKSLIFFRVSLINDKHQMLYDSHTKRVLGEDFSQEFVLDHPEVTQAFEKGIGYYEGYSTILSQRFVYIAQTFNFNGKTYVLRTAFPFQYMVELTHDFKIGFFSLAVAILLLFSIMTWFIIHYLTSPIQQIITAIRPYQEGKQKKLPHIKVRPTTRSDEFCKLADTLNSLSTKIQKHINTLVDERNEKKAILESLREGVIAVDNDMKVAYANAMALKLLGFEEKNLIGLRFSVTEQHKCYSLLARCQKEQQVLTDTLEMKKNGERIYLELITAPQTDNMGAILVMQDKTAHHRILEMRKDFVANASHELKTPITIIQGFAEALHDNAELSRETTKEITSKIVRNCERMTTLIKDLLALTDIEHIPEYRLISCDLIELINTCSSTVQDAYPDAIITIEKLSDKDFHLTVDPNLIEMALINLIENAAKYSIPPPQIKISLDHVGDNIKIEISDKGIGIPESDLKHIFDRFYTVNKIESRKKGGSGLGLAIVQTIIEKHFGEISVESEIGKGTEFTILLPITEVPL